MRPTIRRLFAGLIGSVVMLMSAGAYAQCAT